MDAIGRFRFLDHHDNFIGKDYPPSYDEIVKDAALNIDEEVELPPGYQSPGINHCSAK